MIFLIGAHVAAIYIGAHIAQLENTDIWRAVGIAFLSYLVMVFVGLVLFPLALVPILGLFVDAIILGLGTAIAAKILLSCDWSPAWTIATTAVVAKVLIGLLFSSF